MSRPNKGAWHKPGRIFISHGVLELNENQDQGFSETNSVKDLGTRLNSAITGME